MNALVRILICIAFTLSMIGCASAPPPPAKKPIQQIHSDYNNLPAAETTNDDIKIGMTKDQVREVLRHRPEAIHLTMEGNVWAYGEKRTTNPQGYMTQLIHEYTFENGRLINKHEFIRVSPLGW